MAKILPRREQDPKSELNTTLPGLQARTPAETAVLDEATGHGYEVTIFEPFEQEQLPEAKRRLEEAARDVNREQNIAWLRDWHSRGNMEE